MRSRMVALSIAVFLLAWPASAHARPGSTSAQASTPSQTNAAYAESNRTVRNTFVTTQQTSCYRPEVPAAQFNFGPAEGYSGETPCSPTTATTGEDTGLAPYLTQSHSNPGYPDSGPMVVKDHSESSLAADPAHPDHLIGSSKWETSPEGGIHVLGFFESYDGGRTWPFQGHIPGYEGWTQITDPSGAFDSYGNYYELQLPYQFSFNPDGSRNYSADAKIEPNPTRPNNVISLSEHPYKSENRRTSRQWSATNGNDPQTSRLDILRASESVALDKQWLTIDTRPDSPHRNRMYAMWSEYAVNGDLTSVASYADARPNGTHSPWSAPITLPSGPLTNGVTFVLPRVAANGWVYTPLSAFTGNVAAIGVDISKDGGKTWHYIGTASPNITTPPSDPPGTALANTTISDGIFTSFAVGNDPSGRGPLYLVWEDYRTGVSNVMLSASSNGGVSWSAPLRVNDNAHATDAFQPTVAVQDRAAGTVSVTFYDRRLPCPGTTRAADVPGTESYNAGLRLDTANPRSPVGAEPPYGVSNYCVDSSVQYYRANLTLFNDHAHNIRLTKHSWDPQLNPHRSSAQRSSTATFIGDYYGDVIIGGTNLFDFVSTFDSMTDINQRNPAHQMQQVLARLPVPTS
ncbi:hypothetical protein [Amnibacterium sp.]|uniref:hypothetical protein n=1 Tax=Amnibacterium sp. TaxID=1872496 RepID=UPI0026059804|nr:hypothetical protein [Amnibacterium sp.]MCU1471963.1 exo-alpha-sialidase [Amnibacterium sp.]